MKKIRLTVREFYLFKEVADFLYEFSYSKNLVVIKADAHQLETLGY